MVAIGWGGHRLRTAVAGAHWTRGKLIQLQPSGGWRVVADITGFEGANNPAGGVVDRIPTACSRRRGARSWSTRAGNSLLEVAANGHISLVATFPATPAPPPFNSPMRCPHECGEVLTVRCMSARSPARRSGGAAAIYRVRRDSRQWFTRADSRRSPISRSRLRRLYVLQYATAPVFFGGPVR